MFYFFTANIEDTRKIGQSHVQPMKMLSPPSPTLSAFPALFLGVFRRLETTTETILRNAASLQQSVSHLSSLGSSSELSVFKVLLRLKAHLEPSTKSM